ncbi:MAG: hypothetical protein IPM69_12025 [Ignavibacteria bacterium]|nr:hypothetical protein [Ignavibacteria bacterium]
MPPWFAHYSRIPYAAVVKVRFLRYLSKLHPTKDFPHISLLVLCGIAFIFSLMFKMKELIIAILANMRIIIQSIGGAVGVMLLRRKWSSDRIPFQMWLYPIPAITAILLWIWLFSATMSPTISIYRLYYLGIDRARKWIVVYF